MSLASLCNARKHLPFFFFFGSKDGGDTLNIIDSIAEMMMRQLKGGRSREKVIKGQNLKSLEKYSTLLHWLLLNSLLDFYKICVVLCSKNH